MNELSKLIDDEKKLLASPVFIVGCGRSGTTWLQRLFLAHPNVVGGQESQFFLLFGPTLKSVKYIKDDPNRVGLSSYWQENQEEYLNLVRNIWFSTFSRTLTMKSVPKLLVEKTPTHVFNIKEIKELFPNAKFIHIIRDSRAVVSSLLAANKGWGANWAPSTARDGAILWWRSVNAARKGNVGVTGEDWLEVYYEDLLADTEVELKKIYDFSGLNYDEYLINSVVEKSSFKELKKNKGSGTKVQGKQVKEPDGFYRKGKQDSWKDDLNIFQKLTVWSYTRKLMHECGYDWNGRIK